MLLLNIGTEGGPWQELQDRLEAAAGPGDAPGGPDGADHALLDETLERLGARFRELPPVWEQSDSTPARYLRGGRGAGVLLDVERSGGLD